MESNIYISDSVNAIATAIKQALPKEYKECIEWANETITGTITHRAHYEMERCLTPVVFKDSVWNETPEEIKNRDPEWNYAFSRHSILLNLAKAFAYTKNEDYKNEFILILESFLEFAKKDGLSWRSLESGIRPENWIRSIEIYKGADSPLPKCLVDSMNSSLKDHIKQLLEARKAFQRLSNWGIIQDHGLFVASLYLNDKESLQIALSRLEEESVFQIFDDGVHWEQSPLYHIEILHCLLDTLHLAQKHDIAVSEILKEQTRKASLALFNMIASDGHIFLQGDSDWLEIDDLLYLAKKVFPSLPFIASKQEENYWDFGPEIEILKTTERKSIYLSDSYNAYFRGKNIETHFFAGNMGSGHGHISPLQIDIYAHGKAFITDSGRYTYTDTNERYQLKELKAHNTIILDNYSPDKPSGSWSYTSIPLSIKGTTVIDKEFDYTEATNLSYINKKTAIRRKVVRLGDDIAAIFDEIISYDNHQAEILWHLDSEASFEGSIIKRDDNVLYMWTNAQNEKAENSYMSKYYNEIEKNKTIVISTETKGITTIASVFSTKKAKIKELPIELLDAKRVLTANEGIALEIKSDDEDWIIITRAKELVAQVDILKAGELEGYGMTLIKKNTWKYPKAIF